MTDQFDLEALTGCARALFAAAGLEPDKAAAVATYLVAADAMGHSTHGLALAGWWQGWPWPAPPLAARTNGRCWLVRDWPMRLGR